MDGGADDGAPEMRVPQLHTSSPKASSDGGDATHGARDDNDARSPRWPRLGGRTRGAAAPGPRKLLPDSGHGLCEPV